MYGASAIHIFVYICVMDCIFVCESAWMKGAYISVRVLVTDFYVSVCEYMDERFIYTCLCEREV